MAVILLTGCFGFLGTHVHDILHHHGHDIWGIDCLERRVHPTGEPPAWIHHMRSKFTICDVAHIPEDKLREAEVIVHLAAQVGVADSMTDPLRYVEGNTYQTAQLLAQLRTLKGAALKRFVVASSMSVYGAGGERVKEDAPCFPASIYGLTKYDQERLCLMWGEANDVDVVALRFFNVFGPRQALWNPYTGVLANFAQRLLNDEHPLVYEDGQQTRDFIYVEDVAEAVSHAATTKLPSGVYNVCTGQPTTIADAAQTLADVLDRQHLTPTITGTTRLGDIRHCTGDPAKLIAASDWRPVWTFRTGMQRYARWLKG